MPKIVAGIDYSMSCPSLCIHSGGSWCFENCQFYFLTDTKKYAKEFFYGRIVGEEFPDFLTQEERFDNISNHVLSKLKTYSNVYGIGIEDYAFAAKGRVFHIAENTGLLKHKLWKEGYYVNATPPTVIKKMATGKGNSNKDLMYEQFFNETGLDLIKELDYTKSGVDTPIGDIVDSYYVCKNIFNELT